MILAELERIIRERISAGDSRSSYVAKLHADGIEKIMKKVAEESFEFVLAASGEDRKAIVREAADLVFHMMVLMAEKNVGLDDVLGELDRRFGTSGIDEKKARTNNGG